MYICHSCQDNTTTIKKSDNQTKELYGSVDFLSRINTRRKINSVVCNKTFIIYSACSPIQPSNKLLEIRHSQLDF